MRSRFDIAHVVAAAVPVLRGHGIEAAVLFGSQAREGYVAAGDITLRVSDFTQ